MVNNESQEEGIWEEAFVGVMIDYFILINGEFSTIWSTYQLHEIDPFLIKNSDSCMRPKCWLHCHEKLCWYQHAFSSSNLFQLPLLLTIEFLNKTQWRAVETLYSDMWVWQLYSLIMICERMCALGRLGCG